MKARKKHDKKAIESEEVPFVPDYELLERQKARLSEDEVIAIGTALLALLPDNSETSSWTLKARLDSISTRI
jgi:hypothetical protein